MKDMYSRSIYTRQELESALTGKISPLEINKIIAAYDISEAVHALEFLPTGDPFFFHTSRVSRIIVEELQIFEPDLIISALLHDVNKGNERISADILHYNFGAYVAFLVDLLSKEVNSTEDLPVNFKAGDEEILKFPGDDYSIVFLAEHLDNVRCLEFDPKYNPVPYIHKIMGIVMPMCERLCNKHLNYLTSEIRRELSKFYC